MKRSRAHLVGGTEGGKGEGRGEERSGRGSPASPAPTRTSSSGRHASPVSAKRPRPADSPDLLPSPTDEGDSAECIPLRSSSVASAGFGLPAAPFDCAATDHAETPLRAYQHISSLLERIAASLGKTKDTVQLYDPYYCAGSVKRHLGSLGFPRVYNENEDFYAAICDHTVPDFDVLVTNPPFSGEHIPRILEFAVQSRKPWFILIPQYVTKKPFYFEWFGGEGKEGKEGNEGGKAGYAPLFLGPSDAPYSFVAPTTSPDGTELVVSHRRAASDVQVGFFQCIWFCHLGSLHDVGASPHIIQELGPFNDFALARTPSDLPQLHPVKKITPAERRWRKKQRQLLSAGSNQVKHNTSKLNPVYVVR